MKRFVGFEKGMGIGGWLTNYKRFNVLPMEWRFPITIGDMEHFESYITRRDVDYIKSLGLDHIRMGFDQVVVEEAPGVYRERIFEIIERFIGWCRDAGLNLVLNMHKAIGNYCDIQEKVQLLDSEAYKQMQNIRICGVMGMATFTDDEVEVRKEFKHLKDIFDILKKDYFADQSWFKEISMGMSDDYPIAVEEGATFVRVGSKIFGARNYNV